MDTLSIILVLLAVVAIFGIVAWLFVRENGVPADLRAQVQAWLVGPRAIQRSFGSVTAIHIDQPTVDDDRAGRVVDPPTTLMIADSEIRELREEMHGQLRIAVGRSREIDNRLNDLEARLQEPNDATRQLGETVAATRAAQDQELDRMRVELGRLRRIAEANGPAGERRGEALAELYNQLARVEAAMSQVINPVLLPGEPIELPAAFFPETLVWDNWKDVGDRAFALGNAFNQSRITLDAATVATMERFVVTLRVGLTSAVYPSLKDGYPTAEQAAAMREGLTPIVEQFPAARQQLERAYRVYSGMDEPETSPTDGEEPQTAPKTGDV